MIKYYKLEDKTIVVCRDMMEYAKWFGTADHHVAFDEIFGIRVSTVFLGVDYGFSFFDEEAKPVLFETMVFCGGWTDEYTRRYCTFEDAEAGHKEIVENIKRHPWSLILLPWMKFICREILLPKLKVTIDKLRELGNKIKSRLQ